MGMDNPDDLLARLRTGTFRQKAAAAESLCALRSKPINRLVTLLKTSDDAATLSAVLTVLGQVRLQDRDHIDAVVRCLRHSDRMVRIQAVNTLMTSSPKLKRHMGIIENVAAGDPAIRGLLEPLLALYGCRHER